MESKYPYVLLVESDVTSIIAISDREISWDFQISPPTLDEDSDYQVKVEVRAVQTNVPDGLVVVTTTTFCIGKKPFNDNPTTEDKWLAVDLVVVAQAHARIIFDRTREFNRLPMLPYLPMIDRNALYKKFTDHIISQLN